MHIQEYSILPRCICIHYIFLNINFIVTVVHIICTCTCTMYLYSVTNKMLYISDSIIIKANNILYNNYNYCRYSDTGSIFKQI